MSAINKPIDPKTKQLVEEAEARAAKATPGPWLNASFVSIEGTVYSRHETCNCPEIVIEIHDDPFRHNAEFIAHARTDIPALCSAVREQDKRARHAEAERDTFDKRIDELEAQRHEIIQACLGRDVKDALASQVLGLWKSQSKLTEYAAELEAQLREAVELAAEAVPYVSDYFRDKYEMNDRLAKLTSDSPSPGQTLESR
jgi:hypothetical protein